VILAERNDPDQRVSGPDRIGDILDAGHATIHRAYEPKTKDIEIALDIIEGIMAAIFVHANAAKKVSERVPARRKTPDRP
jgi:hypothetical protein